MNKNQDSWTLLKEDPFFGPMISLGGMCTHLVKRAFLGEEKKEIYNVTKEDLVKTIKISRATFENKNAFAYSFRRKAPINISGINLDLHSIIVGTTGSGKTIFSERIIFDSLEKGKTVLFIDPKGSLDTRDRLRAMANNFNRKFYSVSNFGDSDEISLKLFEGASVDQVKNALMKVLGWSEEYYKNASNAGLLKVLKTVFHGELDLAAIAQGLEDLKSDEVLGALYQIKDICNSDLYKLISGENKKSVNDLRSEDAVVYVGLSSLGYPEVTHILGKLFVYNFSYHASRVELRSISPDRDIQVFFDEFASIGTRDIIHLVNKTRSTGFTIAVAIQCISDLDSIDNSLKGQLFGNTNNFFIGHSHVPSDVEFICSVFGTEDSQKLTSQIDDEEETGKGSLREVQQFKIHPEIVRNLNPGQFIICSKMPNRYWDIIEVIFRDYTKISQFNSLSEASKEVKKYESIDEDSLANKFRRKSDE